MVEKVKEEVKKKAEDVVEVVPKVVEEKEKTSEKIEAEKKVKLKAKPKPKAKKEKKMFFKAQLELTTITRYSVRYRVVNPKGALNSIHHVQFDREIIENGKPVEVFPRDDDFNMDFINADLKNAKPYPDNEAERMLLGEKKLAEEALENTKKKQAEFKKFYKFELVIS